MNTTNYIFRAIRKAIVFPFKLVGNTMIALGFTLSVGINSVLFPEDAITMVNFLKEIKDNLKITNETTTIEE